MKREHREGRGERLVAPRQPALFEATAPTVVGMRDPAAALPPVVPAVVAGPPIVPPPTTVASGRQYLTADLRAATGLSRTAMDFYLRTGVIQPSTRTESGYLLFDEAELAILREVIAWRTRGISLKDIRARLGREHTAGRL